METLLVTLQKEPIVSFAILLAVILVVPILSERIRIPGVVGLLFAGVILGSHGLGLLDRSSEALELLSDIGLVYLMFVAGLEIDIEQFKKTKYRSVGFGFFTFAIALLIGTCAGRLFGFGWNSSVLIGSLFGSHTLLAYPIVSRLGVINNEAVTVTIGATIFTDIGTLLVLAICVGVNSGEFSTFKLISLVGGLFIYAIAILFGFDRLGKEFFKRSGNDEGNQFLFILLVVFLSSLGAQLIGVEKIVGAFLAGLAVNDTVGEGPVKEKVVFVGSVLFIPIFFVNLGLIIDLPAFMHSLSFIGLTAVLVIGPITSKFLAAALAKFVYRYTWLEGLVMWALSLPQVAATLAATLVGYRVGLLTSDVLNSVIVLMVVTSILGSVLTARLASKLIVTDVTTDGQLPTWTTVEPFSKVIVPISNPRTEQYLIEMAALIARHESGQIVPLAIATVKLHMDAPEVNSTLAQSQSLLENARQLSADLEVQAEPLMRIDDGVPEGICRASREQNASLIVMGWSRIGGIRARLFGNVINSVLWSAHCSVAVVRLLNSPFSIRRILIPIENLTVNPSQVIHFARILADANQAQITLVHVCDRHSTLNKVAWNRSQLSLMAAKWLPEASHVEVQILPDDNVVHAIANAARNADLVILRSLRRRTSAGGLSISDVTTQLIEQLRCSIVMLSEPQKASGQAHTQSNIPNSKTVIT